jgi:bifunctional pyridoxal-dependent enzyme with beta-cystathionase and maltose regulon repressor activities
MDLGFGKPSLSETERNLINMKKGTILLLPICMLALTLVITSFVNSPARASATSPILGHYYNIVNVNSGKLMEVYNNDPNNGAKVDQWGGPDGIGVNLEGHRR